VEPHAQSPPAGAVHRFHVDRDGAAADVVSAVALRQATSQAITQCHATRTPPPATSIVFCGAAKLADRNCRRAGAADRQRPNAVHAVIGRHAAGPVLPAAAAVQCQWTTGELCPAGPAPGAPPWKSRRWCSALYRPARHLRSEVFGLDQTSVLVVPSCPSAKGRWACWAA